MCSFKYLLLLCLVSVVADAQRIFSRKRRFLLMPKGCHLKFTTSLTKRLISKVPSGFNFVIEAALYYPAVTARIDLIPKRLRPTTTTTPAPKGSTTPLIVHIPGSLIQYKARPALKPMKPQRIDVGPVKWIDSQQHEKYSDPGKWTKWTKYGSSQFQQKYSDNWSKWTTPLPRRRYENKWHQPSYKWATGKPDWYGEQSWRARKRWYRSLPEQQDEELSPDDEFRTELMHFSDLEPFEDWRHFHSHRDRRQLFHQLEGLSKIFGLDMKSCILRAICESKRFLLPPGYSMIEDILRVVFTFPTISGLTDDYSQAMRSDYKECEKYLGPQCPFSVLSWLMNPGK